MVGLEPSNDHKILKKDMQCLITWITKRYNRKARPDEFNRRINRCKQKIQDILKKYVKQIHGLYIELYQNSELNLMRSIQWTYIYF